MKTGLLILNILLISAVVFLFVRGNFWNKTKNHLREKRNIENTHTYDMNRMYQVKKDMHTVYDGKAKIVMFGDSHTEFAEWHELLAETGVLKRGIGGDITEGMLNRIETVLKHEPEICFFMGGVNDFINRVSYSKTVESIIEIIRVLKENDIRPVIQSVLYVGRSYPNNERINTLVERINKELIIISDAKGADYIDLNKYLAENGFLKEKYTYDGLHLNADAYEIWARIINEYLGSE